MSKTSDPKGWGIAAMVVLLAVVLTGSAYAIHLKTYCNPTHPTCMKIGPAAPHGEEHGADTHATDTHAPSAGAAGDAKHADDHSKADTSKASSSKSGGH